MTSSSLINRFLYGITNWALFIAGIVNLAIGTWSAAYEHTEIAVTSLTAGLVLLFASTIDRFESLKGLGIEARTRQLDEKIEQADDAIRRLRELAELTGATLVSLDSKVGRHSGPPSPREAYTLVTKVYAIMHAMGSKPEVIASALRPWAKILCCNLGRILLSPIEEAVNENIQRLEAQKLEYSKTMKVNDPEYLVLTREIEKGRTYNERLYKLYQFELEDYPDRFFSLFEDVPFIEAKEFSTIKQNALRFKADMEHLRRSMILSNPEAWFLELEKAEKTQRI